jgi:hypothetical protein
MTSRKRIIAIGTIVNLLLAIKYYFDYLTIDCEPCLPNEPCPLCRTEFMENFWLIFFTWNLIGFIILNFTKKRIKTVGNN